MVAVHDTYMYNIILFRALLIQFLHLLEIHVVVVNQSNLHSLMKAVVRIITLPLLVKGRQTVTVVMMVMSQTLQLSKNHISAISGPK